MGFQRKKPAAIGTKALFPGFIPPALASPIDSAPSGDRWIHEIKFDGYRPEEMVGRSGKDLILPEDLDCTRREMKLARSGQLTRNFETRYIHKNGDVVPLAWSGVWSEPEQKHFFFGRDMTDQKIAEDQLRRLAHYDQLTGLPNRTTLE